MTRFDTGQPVVVGIDGWTLSHQDHRGRRSHRGPAIEFTYRRGRRSCPWGRRRAYLGPWAAGFNTTPDRYAAMQSAPGRPDVSAAVLHMNAQARGTPSGRGLVRLR